MTATACLLTHELLLPSYMYLPTYWYLLTGTYIDIHTDSLAISLSLSLALPRMRIVVDNYM